MAQRHRHLVVIGILWAVLGSACSSRSAASAPGALTENDFASDETARLQPGQIGVTFMESMDAAPDGVADTRVPGLDIIPFEVTTQATYEYELDPRSALSHAVLATGDAEAVLLDLTPASPAGSVVLKPGWYALLLVSGNTTPENYGEDSRAIFFREGAPSSLPASVSGPSPKADAIVVRRVLSTNTCASCDLSGAKLQGANLNGADLGSADLKDADLTNAKLRRANLKGAVLTGTTLTGADLSSATWTDGSICKEGSTGTCLTSPTTGFVSLVASSATLDVIAGGVPLLLTLRGTTADGLSTDVAALATWTTSAPGQVNVSAGKAEAPAGAFAGSEATVTGTYQGKSATLKLTVVRGLAITPDSKKDPIAGEQWHLVNTGQKAYADTAGLKGQDLHLQQAYRLGLTGKGVKVAVIDGYAEKAHEDLDFVTGSWNFRAKSSDPTAPETKAADGGHGTAVAGIIAMLYDNGKGGMGVAPKVSLNAYSYLNSDQLSADEVACLGAGTDASKGPKSDDVAVFNMSTGVSDLEPTSLAIDVEKQLKKGTEELRGKRGAIYVKSAGNEFMEFAFNKVKADCTAANDLKVTCSNANTEEMNTVPWVVVVGALNASGKKASYSTAGSAIWVSAPGGEAGQNASLTGRSTPAYSYEPGILTTDRSTCSFGYSRSSDDYTMSRFDEGTEAVNASCNYTNSFNGTSAAAPAASGAIALLLEARPTLTWREVKHLLAVSARKVDDQIKEVPLSLGGTSYVAEQGWTKNAAGYWFHNWYGFGAVDVDQMLEKARAWKDGSLGTFVDLGWKEKVEDPALAIPDASATGATSTISIDSLLVVEAVQIRVEITHPNPSDVGIELKSPKGTNSILFNVQGGYKAAKGLSFVLSSNAFYGEDAKGMWTVKIVDGRAGNTGTLTSWKLRILGH